MKNLPFLMLCVLGGLLAVGCGREGQTESPAQKSASPVRVEKAERRDLTRSSIYIGSVEPVRVARMASPAEGPIVKCAVREGDRVAKDEQLVRVGRSAMAEAGLEAAREELKRQEADFQRVERLVASGALAGEQLEIARAALKRAQAQVAGAETAAGDYDVRAPWAGVVSKVWVAEGNFVAPRVPLVDIYDTGSLRVRFGIPEEDVRRVVSGAGVRIALDAWPGRTFQGRVERVYPQLDALTRTLTVEATIASDVSLLSGLFARIEVPIETATGAVIIPSKALQTMPNGQTVVFVVQDEKAIRRNVSTGLEADGLVQIAEGVVPGEDVVVSGQESLKDGSAVKVMGKPGGNTPEPGPHAPASGQAKTPEGT